MWTKILSLPALALLVCVSGPAHAQPAQAAAKFFGELFGFGRSSAVELGAISRMFSYDAALARRALDLDFASASSRNLGRAEDLLTRRDLGSLPAQDVEAIYKESKAFTKDDPLIVDLDATSSATDAASSMDPLKFSILDGKLKIGKLKKFSGLQVEGGELNVYKIIGAGGLATYCGVTECYNAAARSILDDTVKLKDYSELSEKLEKAKKRITQPAIAD